MTHLYNTICEVRILEKEVYFVSIKNLTCNRCATHEPTEFKIALEPYKARVFQKLFQQLYRYETVNTIPINGESINNQIDTRYKKIYALIHEFGDEETKRWVEQMPYFS